MKLQPLADRVVVKLAEKEERTVGGVILPDTAKEKPPEAEVIGVGKGRTLENGTTIAPEVKVGDRVLFAKYSGTEVKVEGEQYLILRESDILATL